MLQFHSGTPSAQTYSSSKDPDTEMVSMTCALLRANCKTERDLHRPILDQKLQVSMRLWRCFLCKSTDLGMLKECFYYRLGEDFRLGLFL